MMKWEEFSAQLRETGEYETPSNFQPPVIDRMLGRFDWRYHSLITYCLWSCGALAKRGVLDDAAWAAKCLDVIHVVERCGNVVTISIPQSTRECTPCVYASNHMSVLETIILPAVLVPFGHPTFVVKTDLLKYPALRQVLRSVDPITVTRDNPREDFKRVLKHGKESLERGRSVLIFPQSTRHPVFDPSSFNSLAVKLAARSNVPVVPLALKTDFSGIGPIVKEFGRLDRAKPVIFRFGTPLDACKDPKKAHADVLTFIGSAIREWGGTVLSGE
jgi:1-acyl-sn-glycerol-3-phosphate acyltransferase